VLIDDRTLVCYPLGIPAVADRTKGTIMSSITYLSSALLFLVLVSSLLIFVRGASLPASRRRSSQGWLVLALYLGCVLGGLLLWGGETDGLGIAAGLLGLPWSALSAFVLNGLLQLRAGLFGASWETTSIMLSIGAIGINIWLAYHLGQHLPASGPASIMLLRGQTDDGRANCCCP
jgi:hypothetical protein